MLNDLVMVTSYFLALTAFGLSVYNLGVRRGMEKQRDICEHLDAVHTGTIQIRPPERGHTTML